MADKRDPNNLSVDELEQLLYLKKQAQRRRRWLRLKAEGRVVEIDKREPREAAEPANGSTEESLDRLRNLFRQASGDDFDPEAEGDSEDESGRRLAIRWRWVANKLLLLVEIAAVVGLVTIAILVWGTARELNQEIAVVQQAQSASVALPTPTATPVIGVAVLPSGHKPPINGRPPEPGEAGDIPEHLLPIIDAYVPPPIPTPGPEQARRIQIPAINIDKPIVQGDEWEQLKKGVGQHIGSALPGQKGNLVLSAHNDIYGEIFRHLDRLRPGDEIIISTDRQSYTYIVRDIEVVGPTDVWVMGPTDYASATLISCYPYLVNNKRIAVQAELATRGPMSANTS
ncbi:MAG: sortase [Candidatus Promineifilaceae bacterium]